MSSSARASSSARTGRKTSAIDANAITVLAMIQQATEVRPILSHISRSKAVVFRDTRDGMSLLVDVDLSGSG